jgi:EAL domain-containing protein (putative c-di-GMP-specific phosphodiesterase class I)
MLFIRHVAILLIVAIIAFITILVYSVLYHKQAQKAISVAMLTDRTLECPNVEQFRRNAIEVVYSQKQTYAVLFYQLRRLHHIVETLGEQKAVEIFRFVAKVFESFCTLGETYGYAGDGNFLLLNRYQSEKQLSEKVRLLEAVINKSDLVKDCGISIKFTVGAYLTSQGKRTLPQMIECATLAAQSAKSGISQPYVMYTDAVNEEIARNERIEAQMENALSSGEFRLFLQPKYSVKNDQIDSAEALVRWFDPTKGEYRFPAAFIGLFESNGFIIKLDHFIYLEVLKYMSHAAERGERIVPVSINVSRVTAMSDDFLDFYIGNKNKYQIGDRFITLELTESFAMGNYEQLLEIVNKLHENGIRCSIDDFGLGYSSFNIIKEVPIDELKLDRLFLSKGLSDARDNKILQSMIKLAKDIGVDIVQEGVETEEMFKRVVEMGCDVIQGYYYAKAISLEEYRIFLNTNTSIKYKAKVK